MSDRSDHEVHQDETSEADHQNTILAPVIYPEISDLEIHHLIGKGGSGTVYKGSQPFLNRDVAIKLLNADLADETFTKRFHREAQILARLTHPNIVTCYQAGMSIETQKFHSAPFIAMEYINGPTLLDWIQKTGKLDESLALDICADIASALNYALQQNIIHRDVKAENILLKPLSDNQEPSDDGGLFQFTPKLADLGIARTCLADNSDNLTIAGYMIGTPSSMAPEQFNEPDKVDFKADIYGLGCVLFHMLAGKKPFQGKNLTELVISKNSDEKMNPITFQPTLDKELAALVSSMLSKDKEKRPSYTDLINKCQTISNRLKSQNKPRKKGKYFLLVSILIIAGSGASLLFWQSVRQFESPTPYSNIPASKEAHKPALTAPSIHSDPAVAKDPIQPQTSVKKYQLNISYFDKQEPLLSPGESYHILIESEQDVFVHCYFKDQKGDIVRFFPNRFQENTLVSASSPLKLPGEMPFELNASQEGVTELISCFAFDKDITPKMSDKLFGTDFEKLPFSSLEQLRSTYISTGNNILNEQSIELKVGKKTD